jgi:hypothetical protein
MMMVKSASTRVTLEISTTGIVRFLVWSTVFLLGAHLFSMAVWSAGETRLGGLLVEKFSFEKEGNFPTFFSAFMLLFASGLFWLIARCARERGDRTGRYWFALAGVFLFLSFDEAVQIHEKLDTDVIWDSIDTSGFLAWPWVIVYGGIVLVFCLAFGRFWAHLPGSIRWPYGGAAAMYVGAALGFEMLEAWVSSHHDMPERLFHSLVTGEETLEMAAVILTIRTSLSTLSEGPSTALLFARRSSRPRGTRRYEAKAKACVS